MSKFWQLIRPAAFGKLSAINHTLYPLFGPVDAMVTEIRSLSKRHMVKEIGYLPRPSFWSWVFSSLFSREKALERMLMLSRDLRNHTRKVADRILQLIAASYIDMIPTKAIDFNRRVFEFLLENQRNARIQLDPVVERIYNFYIDSYRWALGRK